MNSQQQSQDEIDIFYLFKKLNQLIKAIIVLCFKVLHFIVKSWIIILALIILGVVYGYFQKKKDNDSQKSKMLVRVNYDMGSYLFNTVDLLNDKIKEKDSLFLSNNGLLDTVPLIKKIEIEPVVNFYDIVEKYYGEDKAYNNTKDRYFESLIRNLEFEEGPTVTETFNTQYKYYDLDISLDHKATYKTLDTLIAYVNNNPILQKLNLETWTNFEARIKANDSILKQMDRVIESYGSNDAPRLNPNQLYVNKDLNINLLFQNKIDIIKESDKLKQEMVLSRNIAVVINKPYLSKESGGIIKNKMLKYPVLFVLLFLFLAFGWYCYKELRKIANSEMDKSTI